MVLGRFAEKSESAQRILKSAAELIAKEGLPHVKVKDVAVHAGVTPSLVHTIFGNAAKGPTIQLIYGLVFAEFISEAKELIQTFLEAQPRHSTPVDQLIAILQATLKAFTLNPIFGKLVLKEAKDLDATRKEVEQILHIFSLVDKIVAEARSQDEISGDFTHLTNSMIREILFGQTYHLLTCVYLGTGRLNKREPWFDDRIVEVEVLRTLSNYCSDTPRKRINAIIEERQKK